MKVLNLYAGIGGNRKLWTDCEVTAVELDPEIACVYQKLYPNDIIYNCDAHGFLERHFREFDFIWSSPPCQSHSSFRQNRSVRFRGTKPVYPDMTLYQEIIFLQANAVCPFVVENVKPYYEPLIRPTKELQRHLFWSNFPIPDAVFETENLRTAQIPQLQKLHGIDLTGYKLSNKRQVLRNCVLPELGLHIFNQLSSQPSVSDKLSLFNY